MVKHVCDRRFPRNASSLKLHLHNFVPLGSVGGLRKLGREDGDERNGGVECRDGRDECEDVEKHRDEEEEWRNAMEEGLENFGIHWNSSVRFENFKLEGFKASRKCDKRGEREVKE